ncbi:hypothetical protein [Caulobacter sp. 17J65-9]|uniref:hypothetical protein n=1 Tax=Caulobacter sp. 17J65-9 TaxID=2709382 RepID=UPI0013CD1B5A|nr:hypothetical protein [Caulobacter sp. 17J65-9]NEX92898.1 hypothetical protein [Caulobacter sp. 17J65-9]
MRTLKLYTYGALAIASLLISSCDSGSTDTQHNSAIEADISATSSALTRDDISKYGHAALRAMADNYVAQTPINASKLIGREFSIEDSAAVDYSAYSSRSGGTIKYSTSPEQWVAESFDAGENGDWLAGFMIDSGLPGSRQGSVDGENAFGARWTTEIYEAEQVALVNFKQFREYDGDGLPSNGTPERDGNIYTFTTDLAAGQDAPSAIWVVSGVIAKLPSGQAIACYRERLTPPTYRSETYTLTKSCLIGADIRRVALVNEQTREVLAEWKQSSGNASAK